MDKVTIDSFLENKDWKGGVELVVDQTTTVPLTHLDKIYWKEEGYTKCDLIQYYLKVSKTFLPYLQNRPAILKRYPNGVGAVPGKQTPSDRGTDLRIRDGGFYQHNFNPENAPPFLKIEKLETETTPPVNYAIYTNLASLIYLTNLGTIAHNPWHSRLPDLDSPDYIVFDLDPHQAPFENVIQLALVVRDTLKDTANLKSFVKTSGSSGLHLFVPLKVGQHSYQDVASFAEKLAATVTRSNNKIATLERKVEERQPQQVYLDWLQNARGKAVAAAYTVRAKPGATVSMPLSWQEVETGKFSLADFTIETAPARLTARGDIWKELFSQGQTLPSQPG